MLTSLKILKQFFLAVLMISIVGSAFGTMAPLVCLPVPQKTHLPPKKLTLKDAIFLALRTNPNVRIAEIKRIEDKFALEVARDAFMPQYSFNASATWTRGGTPSYVASPQVSLLMAPGTKVSLGASNNFIGPGGATITNTITQPLLQGFGPKVTFAPLMQAIYTEQTNRLALKNTIITTVTGVITSYYALVQAYNNLKTNELALANSFVTLHQFQVKIAAGQAAAMELSDQEAQVASQRLTVTQDKNNIQQAYSNLLTAIGLDPNSRLLIDKHIQVSSFSVPTVDESINLALANNIAYQESLYGLKQSELGVILAEDAQKWVLNATLTNTITPGGGRPGTVIASASPNPFNGGQTVVGGTPGNSTSFGLALSVPIHNLAQQNQLVQARVSLEQQQIQIAESRRQLRTTVITNIQTLKYLQQQVGLAENSVKYAQQALDVELTKLKYGRSTLFVVTQLRTNLTNAQLALISQEISYITALAQFEASLGITLDKWGIKVYY